MDNLMIVFIINCIKIYTSKLDRLQTEMKRSYRLKFENDAKNKNKLKNRSL